MPLHVYVRAPASRYAGTVCFKGASEIRDKLESTADLAAFGDMYNFFYLFFYFAYM